MLFTIDMVYYYNIEFSLFISRKRKSKENLPLLGRDDYFVLQCLNAYVLIPSSINHLLVSNADNAIFSMLQL